jgi:hypothetical protein
MTKNKLVNEIRKVFYEQLTKYKNDVPQDPEGAAKDLMSLIQKLVPLVEKALEKGGPLIAPQLFEDFKDDLNRALKEDVKIPTQNKLSDIMQDVEKASKEIEEKEVEKEKVSKEEV